MTELESIRRKRGREQGEALELSFVKFLAFSCCLLPFFLFVGTDGERTRDTKEIFEIFRYRTPHNTLNATYLRPMETPVVYLSSGDKKNS